MLLMTLQKEKKMAKWNKVGAVKKSPKGNSYIQFDKDVSFTKSDFLQLRDPKDGLNNLLQSGKITEDQYQERLAKIEGWLVRELFLVTEE